jgi:ATP-dependent Clp protease adapter protein ClpS
MMALPEDWDVIDWNQSVIILPGMTEGVPTVVIPSHRYPQYPRGYFMMAYKDSRGNLVVGYNAAEVGSAGKLMSEFVFWHELGHHALNHTGGLGPDQMDGVTFSFNNELDADQHSCGHWLNRGDAYGLSVVRRAIRFFADQGTAPGDNEHPPAAVRGNRLKQQLQAAQLRQFTIQNDGHTSPKFVNEVLVQCFRLDHPTTDRLIAEIEWRGSATIWTQGSGQTARLIDSNEAAKIENFVRAKKRFAGQPVFTMTCAPIIE